MKLTEEQHKVISFNGDMVVNAVAGSGKTTTLIEYSKARPRNSKILYLVFNKSVKVESNSSIQPPQKTKSSIKKSGSLFKNLLTNLKKY